MPKEVIVGRSPPSIVLDPGDADSVVGTFRENPRRSQVEVRWMHEREGGEYVSVVSKAVHTSDGGEIRPVVESVAVKQTLGLYASMVRSGESESDMSKAMMGVALAEIEAAIPVTDGFYVELDRSGLNQLIRAARRARDQAFGADA